MKTTRKPSKEAQALNAALDRRGLRYTKGSNGNKGNVTAADKRLQKRMQIYSLEQQSS